MGRDTTVAGRLPTLAAAVSLGVAGCAGSSPVVFRTGAVPTAQATVTNGACITHRPLADTQRPAHGLVSVDPKPADVTAVWIPGLNQRPCRTATVHYAATVAARLAHDVRSAPRFPNGTFACPADDGSAVDLYFSYGAGHAREYVRVGLRGCTSVGAPGRSDRRATETLLRDLAALAPQPWADAMGVVSPSSGATLTGHLYLVGGPAPGSPRAVSGKVFVTGSAGKYTASAASDGRYTLLVHPGTYSVTGSSPLYNDGSPCLPATKVTVKRGLTSQANVYCQMP